jgi:chaperonin GroEL (HSP60 family)
MQTHSPTSSHGSPTHTHTCSCGVVQDDVTGDGTTSNVILIGEMLKQAERRIDEGMHPRVVADGYEIAKGEALKVLDTLKTKGEVDRALLLKVAATSLRTKIHTSMADQLTEIVTDAVLTIAAAGSIDLHMVEIMMMMHRSATDTKLVKGASRAPFLRSCSFRVGVVVLGPPPPSSLHRGFAVSLHRLFTLALLVLVNIGVGAKNSPWARVCVCAPGGLGGRALCHNHPLSPVLTPTFFPCLVDAGLVMDHGARHPNMPKELKNAYVLTCNVSLEYEKTEVNASFFYKTAEEREKMVKAEREFIDRRCDKIIALKKKMCDGTDKTMIVVNQKGIDPQSLDMLAAEGIVGLRRAKRRNMERLTLACGGEQMNSVDDLDESCLGFAGHVYEHVLGEQKFTFMEEVKNPKSVSILIKGPNKHTLTQIKDAVNDGLRAVKNAIDDNCVVPGAGAVEMAIYTHLKSIIKDVKGKARLGVEAYADAILIIPKTLAKNSGYVLLSAVLGLVACVCVFRLCALRSSYYGRAVVLVLCV